jgi:hypothetical protein
MKNDGLYKQTIQNEQFKKTKWPKNSPKSGEKSGKNHTFREF